MPRGQPDYGEYAVKEVAASVSDMGEVAARLGSIVTFDKRGDVVDFDNFEEPALRWEKAIQGASSYARHSSNRCKSGSQALELYQDGSASAFTEIRSGIAVLGSKNLGMEISYSTTDITCLFNIYIVFLTGTKRYEAEARIDFAAYKFYVCDENGDFIEIGSFYGVSATPIPYHTIKLVADFDSFKYKRLLLDNYEYDISAIGLLEATEAAVPVVLRQIEIRPVTTNGGTIYVDDFVFTQAEP